MADERDGEQPAEGAEAALAAFGDGTTVARRHVVSVLDDHREAIVDRIVAVAAAIDPPIGQGDRAGSADGAPGAAGVAAVAALVAFVAGVLRLEGPVTRPVVQELADRSTWPGAQQLELRRLVALFRAAGQVLGEVVVTPATSGVEAAATAGFREAVEVVVDVALLAACGALDQARRRSADRDDPDRPPAVIDLHDESTGLAARALLADRLRQVARRARRRPATAQPALLFVGLSAPPELEDGAEGGLWSNLLPLLARRLGGAVRPEDTLARLATSELAVLCEQAPDRAWALSLAGRVVRVLAAPVVVAGRVSVVGVSVGVAVGDRPGWDPEALLTAADHALFRARASGPGHIAAGWLEEPLAWG
jgi:diguanylate cyclase (GGDEF)-like protein